MAIERLWEKMEEEEGKIICGRKKKGLREKEEEKPENNRGKIGNRKKNSVLLKGTEKKIRFSLGEPKKKFGSLKGTEIFFRFSFDVAIGVVAREMGQKRGEPKF